MRDTELWLAQEHADKSLPDAAKVKEFYAAPCQVMGLSQLAGALEKQDKGVTISDVVITGENKNKHCFKRIFNVGTGELMYMRDDAAIFGKEGRLHRRGPERRWTAHGKLVLDRLVRTLYLHAVTEPMHAH